MKRFKLGFRNASVEQKRQTAGRVARGVSVLPANKRAGAPIGKLQTQLSTIDDLRARIMRTRNQLKSMESALKLEVSRMCEFTTICANAVWVCSAGDEGEMRKAGLDIAASTFTPVSAPNAQTHFRGRSVPGGVKLLWKNPVRRCWHEVQYRKVGRDAEWIRAGHGVARARLLVTKLEPGALYQFRVKAHHKRGESPWSSTLVSARPL